MRKVIGFHACERAFAEKLRRGDVQISQWRLSENRYDWLGPGIYFWEGSLRRAKEFARDRHRKLADPMIVEAEIDLGDCFDLTETEYLDRLRRTYDRLVQSYHAAGLALPKNRGKLRDLDCLVISEFLSSIEQSDQPTVFHTVRCPFEEGEPVFPGSYIRRQTHVQIAVRDARRI